MTSDDEAQARRLQVLRTIDKLDKIGVEGVIALLQKPPSEFGAGLDSIQATLVGQFLGPLSGTNEERLDNIGRWFKHADRVSARIKLLEMLETTPAASGGSLWDEIMTRPVNEDNTWKDGGRPANIGFALDDIVMQLRSIAQRGVAYEGYRRVPSRPRQEGGRDD